MRDGSQVSTVPMAVRLAFAAEAERDFGLNFKFLLRSYFEFGENQERALNHRSHGSISSKIDFGRGLRREPNCVNYLQCT